MLDLLNRPSFLGLRPLHMGKLGPVMILLYCVVEAGLQPKKKAEISCNRPQGEFAWPLRCKAALSISVGPYISVVTITMQHHLYSHLSLDLVAPIFPLFIVSHLRLFLFTSNKNLVLSLIFMVVGSYTDLG
jgi:hypothetical protein